MILQVSGSAPITPVTQILRSAQQAGPAPTAWVSDGTSLPYPPDLVSAGLDLQRLLFVRSQRADLRLHAVDRLVRGELVSVVAVDLASGEPPDPGVLGRFMHLSARTGATVVLITPGTVGALSPAVRVHLRATAGDDGHGETSGHTTGVRLEVLRSRGPLHGGVLDARFAPGMC